MAPEEHKKLSSFIKDVHDKLRKDFIKNGNWTRVWNEHLIEEDLRKKYSHSMYMLATKFWKKDSRIEWCYKTCMDYFYNGGLLKSQLKEYKLKIKQIKDHKSNNPVSHLDVLLPENNSKNLKRKLQLLDVGSCYNPFSHYEEFSCLAIDLTPAIRSVKQCDFLNLKVLPVSNKEPINIYPTELAFLYENTFDIVVFSLVLEYLPAAEQRWIFCQKAWKLLQHDGLLIIISPDSNNQYRSSPMIKSWCLALESINFKKFKYNKLRHLHCLAFRKFSNYPSKELFSSMNAKLMYIQQDFKTFSDDDDSVNRNENDNINISSLFAVLPCENLYED